jgi:hypothetical protein
MLLKREKEKKELQTAAKVKENTTAEKNSRYQEKRKINNKRR